MGLLDLEFRLEPYLALFNCQVYPIFGRKNSLGLGKLILRQ